VGTVGELSGGREGREREIRGEKGEKERSGGRRERSKEMDVMP